MLNTVSQIKCVVFAWIFFHMCKSEYKNILPENKYIFKLFYSRISFPDVKKNSVSWSFFFNVWIFFLTFSFLHFYEGKKRINIKYSVSQIKQISPIFFHVWKKKKNLININNNFVFIQHVIQWEKCFFFMCKI